MKPFLFFFTVALFVFTACGDDDDNGHSERFILLTTPVWESDSLLVNNEDASGEGQMLENFVGDAEFHEDGTGYFGSYTGTWAFAQNETQVVIQSMELDFPLTNDIQELTSTSLKITTIIPNLQDPSQPFNIRMTFKAK